MQLHRPPDHSGQMPELAKEALSNFSTFIRVVASGWVAALLLVALDPLDATQIRSSLCVVHSAWLIAIGAGLCGVCSYAVYMGAFESILLWPVLLFVRLRFRTEAATLLPDVKRILSGSITRELFRERKARYGSPDLRVRELQVRMDSFYAWLVFLYCTFILSLATTTTAWLFDIRLAQPYAWFAPVAIWLVAFSADVSITRDEIWLVHNHKQW